MKKIFTLLLITFFATLSANNSKLDNDKIVACPTATISYPGSPFCTSTCSATVFLTGTDTYTGGTFSSTAGLAINAATGEINPCVSVPGTYTVTYTIPPGGGCPSFMTTTTVTILGDDQITPTSAFMSQTVCVNQPIINITAATTYATGASATGLPPGVTSTWSSNIITISGTPTVPGTYNYTIYTIGGNCFPAANYSGTITVLPYPGASVNSTSVCSGSSAIVTATPSTAGTYSYSWTVPAGATNPGNVASFSTTVAGTYSVILNNTTTGCSGTSASGTVTFNPLPTVSVNSTTVCSGTNAVITATAGTAGPFSYAWTVPTGAANPGNVASFSTAVAGTYSVVITKLATGCSSASASGTVTVIPTPTMTATPTNQTICSGQITMITMTASTPGTSFQWNAVQSGVFGAAAGSGNSINHVLNTIGSNIGQVVYTITPTANGCTGTPMMVTITVMPEPTVMASPSNETINSGQTTNINLSSSVFGTTYSWIVFPSNVTGAVSGSGNSITQTLSLVNTSQSGTVIYSITPNVNGCDGNPIEVLITVNPNLGANDLTKQSFIISPNPVTDILNIKNNQIINKVTTFNQLGQIVIEKEYKNSEVQLDFSGLKTGIYFISVDSDKKQSTFKIVKN